VDAGDVVADRFEVEHLAGEGGMGAVYRARDRVTAETVALKVMRVEAGDYVERFVRESEILADLQHPAIVRYVAHGVTADGEPWLAMEWLEGEDLHARLARGTLTVHETLAIARRLTRALSRTHASGVVHRDLKPNNIFLVAGSIERAKLLDFGIARGGRSTLTRTGTMMGTVGYMAPEQARGDRDVGPAADVFSLGCVLFQCLTGDLPFPGDTPIAVLAKILLEDAPPVSSLRSDVPPQLDKLIALMLAKDPRERLRDAIAVAGALDSIAEGSPAPRPPSVEPPAVTAGERRLVSVILVNALSGADQLDHARIDAAARNHGATLDWLSPSAAVGRVMAHGVATDQAAQAARCCLALAPLMADARMILATGRAEFSGQMPVGEVIDRSVAMLRAVGEHAPTARSIWIDDITAGLLDARFEVGGGTVGLELRAERPRGETTRTLLGRPSPFIGRDRELAALHSHVTECVRTGTARAVLVTAPPGAGKSRLRHELLCALREDGEDIGILIERGDPTRAGSPFGMLAPMIRRSAGITEGEALAVRRRKLAARVARNVPADQQRRVAAFLGEITGAPFDDSALRQLVAARRDATLMGDQMRRAFEDFLAAECAEHPVLIVLDDLHWADRPSVDLLDAALRTLHDSALIVMAFARPDVHDRFTDLWADRTLLELRLAPLSDLDSTRLVREVLGPTTDDITQQRLVDIAAGNALYLEELVRAVAHGDDRQQPDTVIAMVQARVERLEPEARRLLRAASVFGGVFWRGAVQSLLGGARPTAIDPVLVRLVQDELIAPLSPSRFPGESEFAFHHPLVREAAYAMLTERDRAAGHRSAAVWLERVGESDAAVLAEHYERGGDSLRAVPQFVAAAERAVIANDMASANAIAERGVSCGAEGESLGQLRTVQAQALRWRGEFGQSAARAEEAIALLAPESAGWATAATEVVRSANIVLGDPQRPEQLASALGAMVKRHRGGDEVVLAASRVAQSLFMLGRIDSAESLLATIEDAAAERIERDPLLRARVATTRAKRALVHGDVGSHLAFNAAAAADFTLAGDARLACTAGVSVGYGLLEVGQYEEADVQLRAALATAERMGLQGIAAYARHNLGIALARMGLIAEGLHVESIALDAFRVQGDRRGEAAAHIYLAEMHSLERAWEPAERHARAALDASGTHPKRALALAMVASVLAAKGSSPQEIAEAVALSREGLTLLDSLGGVDEGEARIRLSYAGALDLAGESTEARRMALAARDRLLERAAKIVDPRFRRGFIERVPDHVRTFELAARMR